MSEASELRVLQFCHSYYGPFMDCARQYAALFEGTAYKVTTVYLAGEPDPAVERGSASDEVIFLGYKPKDIKGLKLAAMRDIRRIVAERSFVLCIAHRAKPVYVALMATSLPVIGVMHSFGAYNRWSRRITPRLFRKRMMLLGVSNAIRDEMRADLGWPASQIQTLYNRIDLAAVQSSQVPRVEARAALGLPVGAWVVGNAGRLHPDKDQATLLRGFAEALPRLPDNALLVIMGEGRLEGELRALADSLGIRERVRFTGQVPGARRYFKAFDLFALTSDHEPFGMVLLEAMAAGLPLVCSDCGGGPEVVGECGQLFPLRDATALAACLVEAASLSEHALILQKDSVSLRLNSLFTDRAASELFWTLPGLPVAQEEDNRQ